MALVEVDLLGSNGDVIELREAAGVFQLPAGLAGTGLLPNDIEVVNGPGLAWVRSVTPQSREMSFPLLILTSSRAEQEAAQRRIGRAVKWNRQSPASLRWTSEDGARYLLPFAYQRGAETVWGWRTASPTRTLWPMSLLAVEPYWRAEDPVSLPVLSTAVGSPFLPDLANLNVSPSSVLGQVDLVNPGDTEAPMVWSLHGPWTTLALTLDDQQIVFAAVDSSTTLTVDTADGTVIDQTGANRYNLLGPAPRFFDLPAGASQVDVQATGTDTSTSITGYFYPRYEAVF